MKLTLLSDYSLRMLMHLSVNTEALVTINQIAERYQISKNHLMKVAHQLSRLGYVETIRGRSGGLRLAKSADKILLGEVIEKMEQGSILVECFPGGKDSCFISGSCRLKMILKDAQNAFFSHLNNFTLDDLTGQNSELKQLLLETQ